MSLRLGRSSSRLEPGRARTGTRSNQFLSFVGGSGLVVFPGGEEQRVPEGGLVVVPRGVQKLCECPRIQFIDSIRPQSWFRRAFRG
jgi:hypothetical protein